MALPVKRMVLYKHGVGFIERGMKITGKDPIKLSFKKNTMDDILKSLCIFDTGKGKVTGVSYETSEDVSKLLSEKAITVPESEAMVGLLRQLKGYAVKLETVDKTYDGIVVGTQEERKLTGQGQILETENFVVIKDDKGKIRAIEVRRIEDVEIISAEAKDDLDFYLEAVTSERKKNTKGLTIFLEGDDHDITVSYITSMPSWRVSYRLAYDKKKPMLQAWGIIDNQMDEDLKDISLSLVAGKPISFIYDIYTPRYVPRPVVREEVRTVSAPVELESGMDQLATGVLRAEEKEARYDSADMPCEEVCDGDMNMEKGKMKKKMPMKAIGGKDAFAQTIAPCSPEPTMANSIAVATKTVEMGEFFKYDIDMPVTVKRGQSAMVPILQTQIDCIKEHVYNNQKMPRNPVVTMRIKNDTGAVLERGPILVLDENTYVGEAILPYTTIGSENHIAYSVDLGIVVNEKYDSGSELKIISIANYYFQKEFLEWKECEYEVQNKKKEPVDLIIEHPKTEYKVDEKVTQKTTEETESFYRWKFKVEPKTTSKFKVRELITRMYNEEIRTQSLDTIKYYLDNNYINKKDFKDVKDIIDLQTQINELENENSELEEESDQITEEQNRLRENLQALGTSPKEEKLRSKYVDKLDEQETRVEAIKKTIKANTEKIDKLDKQIDKMLSTLRT
jgi:hypothetical protein